MKKLIYILAVLLVVGAVSCGNDEPVIDRDRDYELNIFELFHIGSNSPKAMLQSCQITVHRKTVTADFSFQLEVNGTVSRFDLRDVALTYDADENYYSAKAGTTNEPRITNFSALIDCNDYIAEMSFVLDGSLRVAGTSNELFYANATTVMTFQDQRQYTDKLASYLFALHPDGATGNLTIGNLTHEQDLLTYKYINLEGLQMSVTDKGYTVSGDSIACEKGSYSRPDHATGSSTTAFGDSLFVCFKDLKLNLNVYNNSMSGSCTMLRMKRVTDTIQRVPDVRTRVRIVEVNRTKMTAQGSIY